MKQQRFETIAIHAGQEPDPTTGAVVTPIYATSTYAQEAPGEGVYEYSRTDNPTRTALQTALAELEGAGDEGGAVATASGMAATALIGYLLKPGDHLVIPNDAYGGTYRFFARVLGEQGRGMDGRRPNRPRGGGGGDAARDEIRLDRDADQPVAAGGRHRRHRRYRPRWQRPPGGRQHVRHLLSPAAPGLGADVSLYSTTKYVGGHSDVVGGALVTADGDLLERLRFFQNAAGPVPGPFDAYLTLRGLKTLAVRMDRHCANARRIADFLVDHPAVGEVLLSRVGIPSAARPGCHPDERLRRHDLISHQGRSGRRREGRRQDRSCSSWPRAWEALSLWLRCRR